MTVSTLTNKVVYLGNGAATSFAVPFKVLDEDHLVVERRVEATGEIEYTYIGTEYSYSGIGNDSGTLTLDGAALSSTYELVIERIVPYTQDLDIVNAGGFYPETVEQQLDLTTMQVQQIAAQTDGLEERALRVPEGETVPLMPPLADLVGKFLSFDAERNLIGASGTGNDVALRTDLAASTGGGLVATILTAIGAVIRSITGKLGDQVSVLDFIPTNLHAAIRARTSTTDLAAYFQAALDHIDSVGGGDLYIPTGRYRCGSTIQLCKKLHVRGASRGGTHIQFTHAGTGVPDGSGFASVWPSNASTSVNIFVSDLWVEMIHASNLGAGFYDQGGTYVYLRNSTFSGGKFGIVFDQTEIAGIYTCELAAQLTGGAGLWLVDGPDITPGNAGGYTNQITVDHNCQFNQTTAHAIIDDGGDCHYFGHNNLNGGGCYFAGVANLTIMGGEFESVNGRPTMTFKNVTHYSALGVAGCTAVICGGLITQPPGEPCIEVFAMQGLNMQNMRLTATAVAGCVTGTGAINNLFARLNTNINTPVAIFDGYAVGEHNDGYVRINTTASATPSLTVSEVNALLRCTAAAPVTLTVPPNIGIGYPVGTRIFIEQGDAAGPITLAAGAGVTLNGTTTTAGQYQTLAMLMTTNNRWLVTRQT